MNIVRQFFVGSNVWLHPAFCVFAALLNFFICVPVAGAKEELITETNLSRLEMLVERTECAGVTVDFNGVILWVDQAQNQMVLQIGPDTLRVKMDLPAQPALSCGQQVHLTGHGLAGQGLLDAALADNDGLHGVTENSGNIYLTAGPHPLRAECFNARQDFSFEVDYAGPGFQRRRIPSSVLFREDSASGKALGVSGLNYRCYEGSWAWLPHWEPFTAVKSGTVNNFDLSVRTRDEFVGLQFTGYLAVARDGVYTFWTRSDDGSRLYIGDSDLQLKVAGTAPLPAPRKLMPGQALSAGEDSFWAETEGTVTASHADPDGMLELELSSVSGRIYVELDPGRNPVPSLFSQVRVTGLCRRVRAARGAGVAGRMLVSGANQLKVLEAGGVFTSPRATTMAELRSMADSGQRVVSPLCLTGIVLTSHSPNDFFAFQDDTGGVLVHLNGRGNKLQPGARVVLTGSGALDGSRLFIGTPSVVDNDGVHLRQEKTGAVFLKAGRHSFHLSWFNRANPSVLEVYYQSPHLSRRKVSSLDLERPVIDPATGAIKWEQGVYYQYYAGDWDNVPVTSRLNPEEQGVTTNFNIHIVPHLDKCGLEFDGFLDVSQDDFYLFSTVSDDGSKLFIDEQVAQIQLIGTNDLPPPQIIAPRQILSAEQNFRWSEVEGTVDFAYDRDGSLFLELSSVYGPMGIEVVDGDGGSPLLMQGGRVKVQGFCEGALIAGGQQLAGNLVVPSMAQVQLLQTAPVQWSRFPVQAIGSLIAKSFSTADELVVHVRGKAKMAPDGHDLEVTDSSGSVIVKTAEPVPKDFGGEVEAVGRLGRRDTNVVLQCGIYRKGGDAPAAGETKLPVLTTILQIKQLTREQAQDGYPVKIRGVITLVRGSGSGFIIQDDTSAIDVWWPANSNTSLPRVGDYWEVEGETFAEFSPNIRTRHAVRLGKGVMPEPLHPAWDQLLNGSLDTRYVELQGIVTAADGDGVMLFTHAGKIRVLLSLTTPDSLRHYENALVRIRGCVVPVRDQMSQQVQVGELRLSNASIDVDEPAPTDPFNAGLKHASELLQFDARAGSLERVKIEGQVVHLSGGILFVMDGTNAVRAALKKSLALQVGDLVEVVGFPELGGPSPVLREAIARETGRAPLPKPWQLNPAALFNKGYDGILVSVDARLVDAGGSQFEKILELQAGNREFVARLDTVHGRLKELQPGSWLRLTGVYSQQDGGPIPEQWSSSFELLLNSPDDVTVLERPPWWTLRRALIFAGGLAFIILAAFFWIVLLRRRVEERTEQLALEVRRREQVQQQNVLEKERSRIAKDMHDQLGASVTRVGLLAELAKQNASDPDIIVAQADKIGQTAFELGRTLDEIVWAVNPKNDSLDKFCDYMAVQAQELFQLTNTLCRVDLPPEMPDHPLTAEVRHNLFLATKEALNNIVRHANAREVWVRFKADNDVFQISIVDDGGGFACDAKQTTRNGLHNMKKRLEDCGGSFALASKAGEGTLVTLSIPLSQSPMPATPDAAVKG